MNKERGSFPLLSRAQIIRLDRLLDMMYRPSEIAELIGVNIDTVRRSYLSAGCPHKRDAYQKIWINGVAFKEWANEIIAERKRKKTYPMKENEAWCMKCNQRVPIIEPKIKRVNYYIDLLQGKCPQCGTTVNRARRHEK